MESVLGRYRNLTILVGVLFLQVLGLAVQVKRSADAEHTRLIRIWAVDAITPFERAFVRAQDGADALWRNYFFLRGVRAENRELKQQIEQMRLEQVRLSEDAAQARRLQSLLNFKEQVIAKTVPAQVIGSSGSDLSRSIYIDKGSNDGIAQDMAVITANGIVGKVLRVYPSTSLILMINDQSSGVGALLEKSRLQGVVRGTPTGELVLDRIMSDEQVTPGETVLSSGGDQIFPKGLPLGTVTTVSPGRDLFLNVKVKPAADLERLEEVLVVTDKQERQTVTDTATRIRAADILAERLPSVPDKPPAAAAGTTAPKPGAAANAKPQSTGTLQPSAARSTKPAISAGGSAPLARSGEGGQNLAAPPAVNNLRKKTQQPARVNASGASIGTAHVTNSTAPNSQLKPSTTIPELKPSSPPPAAQPAPSTEDTPH
jgi:rod shape-determining protein MreC